MTSCITTAAVSRRRLNGNFHDVIADERQVSHTITRWIHSWHSLLTRSRVSNIERPKNQSIYRSIDRPASRAHHMTANMADVGRIVQRCASTSGRAAVSSMSEFIQLLQQIKQRRHVTAGWKISKSKGHGISPLLKTISRGNKPRMYRKICGVC